jgi:hypothetical protein
MREGIANVKELGGESDSIKHVIFGGKAPSHNPHAVNKELTFFSQRLNEPQKEAIKFCLASNGTHEGKKKECSRVFLSTVWRHP